MIAIILLNGPSDGLVTVRSLRAGHDKPSERQTDKVAGCESMVKSEYYLLIGRPAPPTRLYRRPLLRKAPSSPCPNLASEADKFTSAAGGNSSFINLYLTMIDNDLCLYGRSISLAFSAQPTNAHFCCFSFTLNPTREDPTSSK